MNARQTKKKLKLEISRLKSVKAAMQKLNVQHTTMDFQEIRAKRVVPIYMMDEDGVKFIKRALAQDIIEAIKDDITYTVGSEFGRPTITASMFIGRKEER